MDFGQLPERPTDLCGVGFRGHHEDLKRIEMIIGHSDVGPTCQAGPGGAWNAFWYSGIARLGSVRRALDRVSPGGSHQMIQEKAEPLAVNGGRVDAGVRFRFSPA